DDQGNFGDSHCQIGSGATADYSDCTGLFALSIPFTIGTAFTFHIEFSGNAVAVTHVTNVGQVGDSGYDLAHSLLWGGISDVRVGGTTITDFDFGSGSGYDWRLSSIPTTSVPEPATL